MLFRGGETHGSEPDASAVLRTVEDLVIARDVGHITWTDHGLRQATLFTSQACNCTVAHHATGGQSNQAIAKPSRSFSASQNYSTTETYVLAVQTESGASAYWISS